MTSTTTAMAEEYLERADGPRIFRALLAPCVQTERGRGDLPRR